VKYLIIPAKELQCGDVIFTSAKSGPLCGRVLGQNLPNPEKGVAEYRVQVIGGEADGHTTIRFSTSYKVGVAREDDYTEVDVAAILSELDAE
jgi:hypothetical protein